MTITLPQTIASMQDLNQSILELREYSRWFMQNEIKQKVNAQKGTQPPDLTEHSLALIRQMGIDGQLSSSDLSEMILQLENIKRSAKTISVTLAAPTTKEARDAITSWCRSNLSQTALVDFRFNSTILGGAVVRVGSRIFDWSFRKKIIDNRNNFAGILKNV